MERPTGSSVVSVQRGAGVGSLSEARSPLLFFLSLGHLAALQPSVCGSLTLTSCVPTADDLFFVELLCGLNQLQLSWLLTRRTNSDAVAEILFSPLPTFFLIFGCWRDLEKLTSPVNNLIRFCFERLPSQVESHQVGYWFCDLLSFLRPNSCTDSSALSLDG